LRLLWSQTVPPPLRGLSLARERDTVLAWDGQDSLFLFDQAGRMQAQRPSPTPIGGAACVEDGSGAAIIGGQAPVVCWLAPDLSPRWQRSFPQRATALAVEPLGQYIAVADAGSTLHLMDRNGQTVWRATTPRPLHHLAFVPEKTALVGAADFGLVVCFGADGECLWRDGLVAHVGSLATSGDGGCVLLACFGDGLYRYNSDGPRQQRIVLDASCRLAAVSYAGDRLLTVDHEQRVRLRSLEGMRRDSLTVEGSVVALALGALGDYGMVGLADGSIHRVETRADERAT
jgi:hypothetical protein